MCLLIYQVEFRKSIYSENPGHFMQTPLGHIASVTPKSSYHLHNVPIITPSTSLWFFQESSECTHASYLKLAWLLQHACDLDLLKAQQATPLTPGLRTLLVSTSYYICEADSCHLLLAGAAEPLGGLCQSPLTVCVTPAPPKLSLSRPMAVMADAPSIAYLAGPGVVVSQQQHTGVCNQASGSDGLLCLQRMQGLYPGPAASTNSPLYRLQRDGIRVAA
jgi:hypothetical protein